jgi:spermidine synthase
MPRYLHPVRAIDLVTDELGGITVMSGGHPQSHVQPEDPGLLVFEYVQHLAMVLDLLRPGRLAVTHVGGAGLTLARYVEHTRPGSPQIVLEPHSGLTDLVRRELPLARGHRIRVRAVDGATGIIALKDASADVVVLDAYDGGRIPPELVGSSFVAELNRVLRPGGALLMNLADEPGLRYVARVAATVRRVLPHAVLVVSNDVLKGRRFGNVVLAASHRPLGHADLARSAARRNFPTGVRSEAQTARLAGGARPFGAEGGASPEPPDPGRWRRR